MAAPRSVTAMCNRALARIGHTDFITDLATDTSTEGDTCRVAFDDALTEVLEEGPWPFATRRLRASPVDPSTLDNGSAPTGWGYAFALPGDIVSHAGIIGIWPGIRNPREDEKVPFDLVYDGTTDKVLICCDEAAPEILYIRRVENPIHYTAKFSSALEFILAAELALSLKKDPALAEKLRQAYAVEVAQAFALARLRTQADSDPDPDFITARR